MTQTAASALTVLDLPHGERNLIGLARISTYAQNAQLQLAGSTSRRSAPAGPPRSIPASLRRGDTLIVSEAGPARPLR
jgi:hypothetical protein